MYVNVNQNIQYILLDYCWF